MKTRRIMLLTSAATLPGLATMTVFQGPGVIINVLTAVMFCVAIEAACLHLRQQPIGTATDGSAVLTGAILGLCLPPLVPLWMIAVAALFAIALAKHAYGGVGRNIFNPAMAGYAVMIVSFPLALSTWPGPGESPGLAQLLMIKLGAAMPDGFTGATTLDAFRQRGALTTEEFWRGHGAFHGSWLWINLAFLAGGLVILWLRLCRWHAPVAMLATLAVLSLLFFDSGSSASLGSPWLHLSSGATMMAAFFVVTDPVTSPNSIRGQLLFGAGVGLVTFIIRSWGAYPEGVAFAILMMNALHPLIDHLQFRQARHA